MENNIINLDQLTKPLSSNGSLKEAIINRYNEVFGGCWSFRIMEHHMRENEVIVLGELTAGGATRQQFGRSVITFDSEMLSLPSMAEHLTEAADDALIQCAGAFGIKHDAEIKKTVQLQPEKPNLHTPPEEPPANGNGNGSRKLTNRQLAAIFGLGKSQGLNQNDIITLTKARYSREPMELTVAEASELIGEMKSST